MQIENVSRSIIVLFPKVDMQSLNNENASKTICMYILVRLLTNMVESSISYNLLTVNRVWLIPKETDKSTDACRKNYNKQKRNKIISHTFHIGMLCLKRGDLYGNITYC